MFKTSRYTSCYRDPDCRDYAWTTTSSINVAASRVLAVHAVKGVIFSVRFKILGYVKAEKIQVEPRLRGQIKKALRAANVTLPDDVKLPHHWK